MRNHIAAVKKKISSQSVFLYSSVAGISLIYLILACVDLSVPGANYDEMLYQAPAVNFLVDSVRTEAMQINPSVIDIAGRPFPLMLMTYIGSVKVIWHIFIFLLFGISVETARLGSIVLGILAIIFIFAFVRKISSNLTGLIAIALIASSPEYVFYTSRDMTIVFMILAKMAALYFFIKYLETSKTVYILTGSFVLGLGIYDKASFLWFVIALILYLLFFRRQILRAMSLKHYSIAGIGFFTGGFIFFLFNIIRLGETFAPLLTDFHKTSGGVDNSDLMTNLWIRAEQFYFLLSGDGLARLFTQSSANGLLTSILPAIIVLFMLTPVILVCFRKFAEYRHKIFFVLFFFLVPLIMTIFTPSSLSLHHVAIVWPFHLILAAFMIEIIFRLFRSYVVKSVSFTLLFAIILLNVVSVFEIYGKIHDEGSTGNWSETIYELNDYLTELKEPTVLMTWGFTNNLIVTSGGKLTMIRYYREMMKADEQNRMDILRRHITDYRYFLFSVKQPGASESEENLKNESMKLGFRVEPEKSFCQKNGEIVYKLYTIKPIQQNSAK